MGTWPRGRRDFDEEFRLFAAGQWRGLYRVALVLSGDPGIAEDLVQTALMRTHARWPRLREQDPAGYARRVITNAHIDRWRRDRGREQLSGEVPDRETTDVAVQVVERDAVMRALSDLSVQERRVVVLRFLDDATETETARPLGIPLGTVKRPVPELDLVALLRGGHRQRRRMIADRALAVGAVLTLVIGLGFGLTRLGQQPASGPR